MLFGTCAPSLTGASSTHQRPSGSSSRAAIAAAIARRVLPMPPAPTIVTTACSRSSALTASRSCSRPNSAGESGRLPLDRRRLRRHGRRYDCARGRGRLDGNHGVDSHREAITTPRNGGDRLRPEQLAQRNHVHEEVVFLDNEPWPHQIHQLALGDHPIAPLHQRKQHIERARADLGGHAIGQHAPLRGVDLDRAAAIAAVGPGWPGVIHESVTLGRPKPRGKRPAARLITINPCPNDGPRVSGDDARARNKAER